MTDHVLAQLPESRTHRRFRVRMRRILRWLLVIFAGLLFYVSTTLGLFILRVKRPDAERPYRAFGYPVVPALYILSAAAIAVVLLIAGKTRTQAISGLVLVLIGVPIYFVWRSIEGNRNSAADARE